MWTLLWEEGSMVSKAILLLASLLQLTCVRALLDMRPHLFTRMEPPVSFHIPFTQPPAAANNIWSLPFRAGFQPK